MGTTPGYSGYRSKEGYTGHHPRSDLSNIRSTTDQLRSSEALWRSPETGRRLSSAAQRPPSATLAPTPEQRRVQSPAAINTELSSHSRPTHYHYIQGIEGHAGHRPRTPVVDHLHSGPDSVFNSSPRAGVPGQLKGNECSPHRVKYLSHGRGVYVP